jgi:hypothetical protein
MDFSFFQNLAGKLLFSLTSWLSPVHGQGFRVCLYIIYQRKIITICRKISHVSLLPAKKKYMNYELLTEMI